MKEINKLADQQYKLKKEINAAQRAISAILKNRSISDWLNNVWVNDRELHKKAWTDLCNASNTIFQSARDYEQNCIVINEILGHKRRGD